jgi:Rrf2 family protein
MLITRECDYSIRILRAVSKTKIASVQEISSSEHIPLQYAYKICHRLSKAGLLKSHRGSEGGYELSGNLEELTLFDVFKVFDSELSVSDCTCPGSVCVNNSCEHPCRVHVELCRLQKLINSELSAKKLSELF